MSDLQRQIDRVYKDKVEGGTTRFLRQLSLEALGQFAALTPVDTGRARANYNLTVNVRSGAVIAEPQVKTVPGKRKGTTKKQKEQVPFPDYSRMAERVKDIRITDTIYITNNLPYIARLNEGSSVQAPANFIEGGLMVAERTTRRILGASNA